MGQSGFTKNEKGIALFSEIMKPSTSSIPTLDTLTQLDRLECLLQRISLQKVKTGERSVFVVLPSIQNAKPDQIKFWESVLKVCGKRFLFIDNFARLKEVAAMSKITSDIPNMHNGILLMNKEPRAYALLDPDTNSHRLARELRIFSGIISGISRGDTITVVS
jgi:hypothetical protein